MKEYDLIVIGAGSGGVRAARIAANHGATVLIAEGLNYGGTLVAGVWMHFKSLRAMKAGYGEQIREMLAEAENERMHLMFFIEIAKPNIVERFLVLSAQIIFGLFYLFMYVFFTRTAHRMIGYFEDEAVRSYTEYLEIVESGKVENTPAPHLAIQYYKLGTDAKLSDLIRCVRADEQHHSEANHKFASNL